MVKKIFPVLFLCSFAQAQTTFNIGPDAYVQFTNPTTNFGTGTDLRCRNTASETLRVFIGFTTSGLTGTVTACSLKLFCTLGGASSGGQLWSITDDSWTETGITWNNQPARVTDLGALPVAGTSTLITHPVTSYVTGNDTYSFVVIANNSQNTRYEADEAAGTNHAKLVVYTAAAGRRKFPFGNIDKPLDLLAEMKSWPRAFR